MKSFRERELMSLQTKVGQKKFVLVKLTGYQKIYELEKGCFLGWEGDRSRWSVRIIRTNCTHA